MRLLYYFIFPALGLFSCKDHSSHGKPADTAAIKPAEQPSSTPVTDEGPKRPYYLVNTRLESVSYSISCLSKFLLPLAKPKYDTNHYYTGKYAIAVRDKLMKTTDTIELAFEDAAACPACPVDVRDLTEELNIRPLLIQVVMGGEDLTTNSFIGFQKGRLKELFSLSDTEDDGVILKRTDSSTLRGFTFGVDEIVHTVQHNYPVTIDLNTFTVRHPLPDTQYIGFRTMAAESFRAYEVADGQIGSVLVDVKKGDSLTIDTFYRARGKVRLLTGDRRRIEIQLVTGQKKLWSPGAPG